MVAKVVKVSDGWAARLTAVNMERPFHYKVDAQRLAKDLNRMRTLFTANSHISNIHYFREVIA
jgi:hypothetical protein